MWRTTRRTLRARTLPDFVRGDPASARAASGVAAVGWVGMSRGAGSAIGTSGRKTGRPPTGAAAVGELDAEPAAPEEPAGVADGVEPDEADGPAVVALAPAAAAADAAGLAGRADGSGGWGGPAEGDAPPLEAGAPDGPGAAPGDASARDGPAVGDAGNLGDAPGCDGGAGR